MTQEQLSGLADVSASWLSKIERGVPHDRRMAPLSRIAGVLGVGVAELMGQRLPESTSNGADGRKGRLDALRRVLLPGMAMVVTRPAEDTIDLQRLADDAAETWRLRQAGRLSALSNVLPNLVCRGEEGRRNLTGQDRASACHALATIYASASSLCSHVGELELAAVSAALATRVAEEAGSSLLEGIVARRTCRVLLRTGAAAQALDVAMTATQGIETLPRTASADEIAVHGSLLLESAFTAARTEDGASAWKLLAEAERDAARFGLDRVHMRTSFSLGNVLLYGIRAAADLGDPRSTLRRAAAFDPSRLPTELSRSRSNYWIDVARAHASMRNTDDAMDALVRAEQVAPEELRHQIVVRDMVRELLQRKRQSISPHLRGLAERLGMTSS